MNVEILAPATIERMRAAGAAAALTLAEARRLSWGHVPQPWHWGHFSGARTPPPGGRRRDVAWDRGRQPGMALTIEPMLNEGTDLTVVDSDGWTVRTADGRRSEQFEHTVLVTESGYEVLTRVAPALS